MGVILQRILGFVRRSCCRACLIAGPCLLAVGLGFTAYTTWFLHHSATIKGTIVSLREVHDAQDDSITYAPVFTFTASDGRSYAVSSNTGNNPPAFTTGQPIDIRYNPTNPNGAKIDTFLQLWLFPLVFAILGALATAFGYVLLRYERRANPQFALVPGSTAAKPSDLRTHLLGGPKVDSFEVTRDHDTGRQVDL